MSCHLLATRLPPDTVQPSMCDGYGDHNAVADERGREGDAICRGSKVGRPAPLTAGGIIRQSQQFASCGGTTS